MALIFPRVDRAVSFFEIVITYETRPASIVWVLTKFAINWNSRFHEVSLYAWVEPGARRGRAKGRASKSSATGDSGRRAENCPPLEPWKSSIRDSTAGSFESYTLASRITNRRATITDIFVCCMVAAVNRSAY